MTNHLEKLIVVGDRVLIKPKMEDTKTNSGLFLPPGYKEKEEIQSGYVVKVGPGFPIPVSINYIPLQALPGDLAIFLKKGAVEIHYHNEKYFIVPQHSILLLEREE